MAASASRNASAAVAGRWRAGTATHCRGLCSWVHVTRIDISWMLPQAVSARVRRGRDLFCKLGAPQLKTCLGMPRSIRRSSVLGARVSTAQRVLADRALLREQEGLAPFSRSWACLQPLKRRCKPAISCSLKPLMRWRQRPGAPIKQALCRPVAIPRTTLLHCWPLTTQVLWKIQLVAQKCGQNVAASDWRAGGDKNRRKQEGW